MYKQTCIRYKKLTSDFVPNLRGMGFLLLLLCIAFCSLAVTSQAEKPLIFSKIAEGGFWKDNGEYDPHNSRAFSMAWFKDKLYVGTGRDILALRYFAPRDLPPFDPYPVEVPPDPFWHDYDSDGVFDEGEGLDTRAQIWRYTPPEPPAPPETGEWEMVYQAPWEEISMDTYVGREYGYRSMAVTNNPDGTDKALYVGTNIVTGDGALILRTETGEDFEIVSHWLGLPIGQATAIRNILVFNEKLYAAPMGQATLFKTIYEGVYDGGEISFRAINQDGFGNPENEYIYTMCVFNDHIYAGTLNPFAGFEIWKTDGITPDPQNPDFYEWTLVVDEGAYRGPLNETVVSLHPFTDPDGNEYLYVGGGIQGGGCDKGYEPQIGPGTAEMVRIKPDDTWELICGDVREDPYGNPIVPIAGFAEPFGPGFDDPFTGYFWQMEVHNGWLYVGTFDNSSLLPYIPTEEITADELREAIEENPELVNHIVESTGGFDFWKTQDGVSWYPITWTGFHNNFNMGIRSFQSTPFGLFVGVSNEFTDAPVPDGGAQVWLGVPGDIDAPTNLITNPEAHQVKLRWTPSEGALQYRIIRFTAIHLKGKLILPRSEPLPSPEPIGVTTENFFIDTTVEDGKKYQYNVIADTGAGVSGLSNSVGAVAKDIFIVTPNSTIFNRATHQFVQTLTVTNYVLTLMAPVPIVLEGLTKDVTLSNQEGRAEDGSPIIYAPKIPGDGGSVQMLLRFNNPRFAPIKYVPFVIWGQSTP